MASFLDPGTIQDVQGAQTIERGLELLAGVYDRSQERKAQAARDEAAQRERRDFARFQSDLMMERDNAKREAQAAALREATQASLNVARQHYGEAVDNPKFASAFRVNRDGTLHPSTEQRIADAQTAGALMKELESSSQDVANIPSGIIDPIRAEYSAIQKSMKDPFQAGESVRRLRDLQEQLDTAKAEVQPVQVTLDQIYAKYGNQNVSDAVLGYMARPVEGYDSLGAMYKKDRGNAGLILEDALMREMGLNKFEAQALRREQDAKMAESARLSGISTSEAKDALQQTYGKKLANKVKYQAEGNQVYYNDEKTDGMIFNGRETVPVTNIGGVNTALIDTGDGILAVHAIDENGNPSAKLTQDFQGKILRAQLQTPEGFAKSKNDVMDDFADQASTIIQAADSLDNKLATARAKKAAEFIRELGAFGAKSLRRDRRLDFKIKALQKRAEKDPYYEDVYNTVKAWRNADLDMDTEAGKLAATKYASILRMLANREIASGRK